jgi:hypothetical protein
MAQQYVTDSGTLVIPGAYPKITVQSNNSGLATTGVLMLVGESDYGPDYTKESDLESNAYGPDQLSEVIAKYGSGPLVDAFRAATAPSSDPGITGSFSSAIIVKTNPSTKASGGLLTYVPSTYGTLYAKQEGKRGNLITYSVAASTSEVVPTTGSFTYIPAVGTVNAELRVNGDAALSVALSANTPPNTFQSTVNSLAGVTASGGANRNILTVSGTLILDTNPVAAPGATNIQITRSVAWATTPVVGDTLVIPTGSVLAGLNDDNVGAYVVIAATSTTVTATKLSDAGQTGATPGTITNPTQDKTAPADDDLFDTPQTIVAVTDVSVFSPVVISVDSGNPIDGVGKSLEIAELTTGTDLLSRTAYNLSSTVVSWVSKSATPVLLSSATEYKAQLNIARAVDSITEALAAGGEIALKVHYVGTTASLTIDKSTGTFSTTVTGGSGANIASTLLSDFPTIADLVDYLNAQTGYSASAGSASLGQLPLSALDEGVFTICSKWGAKNGRIKVDAYKFFLKLSESSLVQLGATAAAADAGLPAVKSAAFLTGGTKGATTASTAVAAIDALENVRGNFVIPLFSRDAASDVLDGLTESGSTYTIDAINLAVKSHVLKMSTLKKRRNRQAFLSKSDAFAAQKEAASNLASSRCSMAFEDFKQLGGDGSITQFQPWMGAVLAAAMQAAGFYKAVFFKNINTVGIIHAAGDYNPQNDTHVEEALVAGLLPARKSLTGGFVFDSDQTTYTKDANFVFNSIQAMYAADIIALSTAQRMEGAFVGQSVADVSAAIGLSFLEGIMADFLRLKLIAASDDAPKGFKNARIKINGGSMIVEVEVKLAGAIYFIPISFLVSPVTQSA